MDAVRLSNACLEHIGDGRNESSAQAILPGLKFHLTTVNQSAILFVYNGTRSRLFPFWNQRESSNPPETSGNSPRMTSLRNVNAQLLYFHILALKHPGEGIIGDHTLNIESYGMQSIRRALSLHRIHKSGVSQ